MKPTTRLVPLLLAPALTACTVAIAPVAVPSDATLGTVTLTHPASQKSTAPGVAGTPTPEPLRPPGQASPAGLVAPTAAPALPPLTSLLPTAPLPTPSGAALIAVAPPTPAPLPALPTPAVDAPAFHEGGVVFDNPFGFPESVGIGAPDGLLGKTRFQVLDANGPSPAAFCYVAIAPYLFTTAIIDAALKGAVANHLEPGKDYTFNDDNKPGKQLTAKLTVGKDHATLGIWRGTGETPGMQIVGIQWTSPAHGRAVFKTIDGEGDDQKSAFVTVFDHDARTASVDDVVDDPNNKDGPQKSANHLLVAAPQADGGPAFTARSAITLNKQADAVRPAYLAIAANFLGNHDGGAMWLALGNADTQFRMLFVPNDQKLIGQTPPAPHDFYLDGAGLDVPKLLAGPKRKAIVPPDSDLPASYPLDPGNGDPFADPRFDFPQ